MPRGGKSRGRHKGRPKRYLTAEEIRAEEEKKKKESEWKRKKGGGDADDEEEDSDSQSAGEEPEEKRATGATPRQGRSYDMPPSSSESESGEEEEEPKAKGVEGLIEVSNPNRVASKTKKTADIDINAKVELSRKEREELARQRSAASYRKLHEAGKTDEAQRDLARLAIIKQKREEAARKRDAEMKAKEAASKQKSSK